MSVKLILIALYCVAGALGAQVMQPVVPGSVQPQAVSSNKRKAATVELSTGGTGGGGGGAARGPKDRRVAPGPGGPYCRDELPCPEEEYRTWDAQVFLEEVAEDKGKLEVGRAAAAVVQLTANFNAATNAAVTDLSLLRLTAKGAILVPAALAGAGIPAGVAFAASATFSNSVAAPATFMAGVNPATAALAGGTPAALAALRAAVPGAAVALAAAAGAGYYSYRGWNYEVDGVGRVVFATNMLASPVNTANRAPVGRPADQLATDNHGAILRSNVMGLAGDDAGHIRAKTFGGDRDILNFIPQGSINNRGIQCALETAVRHMAVTGLCSLNVGFHYTYSTAAGAIPVPMPAQSFRPTFIRLVVQTAGAAGAGPAACTAAGWAIQGQAGNLMNGLVVFDMTYPNA